MRFCATTLGCKVNQYETQAIESILAARGHERAQPGDGCDACIINTCAVTAESTRKSRQAVRRMKKLEPNALIAVCGCVSQLDPEAAAKLGADLVGGSGDRRKFALEVEMAAGEGAGREGRCNFGGTPNIFVDDPAKRRNIEELPPGGAAGRTRALLKIQDGCDNFCAYCVIPFARGRSRSLPLERVAAHARQLDGQGFREIVVTGIEISSYCPPAEAAGRCAGVEQPGPPPEPSPEPSPRAPGPPAPTPGPAPPLAGAIRAISAAAPRARLRLGSLDPAVVTEGFCRELSAIPNLCAHFHISLQSGCDETLRRMGRKYDTAAVSGAMASIRSHFPDCGITADLITGFPGETGAEFEQTLRFIEAAAFSDMHVFPFSPRPGTRAANMPGQVEKGLRRERARIAAEAAEEMAKSFKTSQIGKAASVLFERQRGGFWTGYSENYLEVAVKRGGGGNIVRTVMITDVKDGVIWGEIS